MRCTTPQRSSAKMCRHCQPRAFVIRASVFFVCLAAFFARADYNLYMFISGIPGEATDTAHANWIGLSSFSQEQVSGLIAPGLKSYSFGISKLLDKSSPTLM